jgi:mono/diheme cytochrome c family protein
MKKTLPLTGSFLFIIALIFLMVTTAASGQQTDKSSPAIPDNLNKIFTNSCMPCHSSKGGMMSQAKLNFTNWTKYSLEKQKEKADAILSILEKAKMPPQSARETRPDMIPTKEQIELIKKWDDSLKTVSKK